MNIFTAERAIKWMLKNAQPQPYSLHSDGNSFEVEISNKEDMVKLMDYLNADNKVVEYFHTVNYYVF